MSGHSRWSQIKRKKGKTDVQRGKLFSKILREITVAARSGGGDSKVNMRLKAAMESAKEANMPADNIKRAIQKGTGDLPGEAYEEITYEGYGPGGVAIFVEALTDNRNRTASEVRHVFAKSEGSLGESGSVAWLFERKGVVLVEAEGVDEDELTLVAADGGAEDVEQDGSSFQVTCAPEDLASVRRALEEVGIRYESAGLTMVPKSIVEVSDEGAARKILRLLDALEESDDVQDVFSNFDIPERVLEAAAS